MKDTFTNQLPPNQKYIGWKEVSEKEFYELFPSPSIQKKNASLDLPPKTVIILTDTQKYYD